MEFQGLRQIVTPGQDLIAGSFGQGLGLATEQCFLHPGLSMEHLGVTGKHLGGHDADEVTHLQCTHIDSFEDS